MEASPEPQPPSTPKNAFERNESGYNDEANLDSRLDRVETERPHNLLFDNTIGYCDSTSVHGFSYLSTGGRNCCERLFWGAVILTGFALASVIINRAFT